MTKKLNNILSSSLESSDLQKQNLSIQISLDGFCFCITTPETKEQLAFVQYVFENTIGSPEALLTEIEKLFKENILLQQKYKNVTTIHLNNLATLVPEAYFNEAYLADYLQNTIKVLKNDYITFDKIPSINTNTVYIPFVNINNFIFEKFGAFDYYHTATLLIKKLHSITTEGKKVYLNVFDNNFHMVVFNNQELEFFNTFEFQTSEDFIYYILFVFEQFNLDPNSIEVTLIGDIEKESELYTILYQYIRNISFLKTTTSSLLNEQSNISPHTNFVILNSLS